MVKQVCPGSRSYFRPKPEYIKCLGCGSDVEIWTDEDEAECTSCGRKISRNIQSCLDWCEYADKCKAIIDEKMQNRNAPKST